MKPAKVSATQSIKACATAGGALRLTNAKGHCTDATTKVKLARPAVAPKALVMSIKSGSQTKTLPLIAGTDLQAKCGFNKDLSGGDGSFTIQHTGKTQIDGTAFVVHSDDGEIQFHFAGTNNYVESPYGASNVYAASAGGFQAGVSADEYASVNTRLLVTVPGAVYTIDAVLDINEDPGVNSAAPYCRVSALVQSATT